MVNLNLSQDVANKREKILTAAHIKWPIKSYPTLLSSVMHRYGSLININPSGIFLSSRL